MRLIKFADSLPYILSADDGANFLKELGAFGRAMICIAIWRRSFLALRVGNYLGSTD
jgi:hypothetical protein